MAMTRRYDVAIIGAGMYGIQAARTYLEIYPDAKIAILEASASLGGAWSKGGSIPLLSAISVHTLTELVKNVFTTRYGHRIPFPSPSSLMYQLSSTQTSCIAAYSRQHI